MRPDCGQSEIDLAPPHLANRRRCVYVFDIPTHNTHTTAANPQQPVTAHKEAMNGGGERLANYQPTDLSFSPDGTCLAYLHAASHQVF